MGERGPVPKPANQRRRRNKTAAAPTPHRTGVKPPPTNGKWHPVARRWFNSLKKSAQSEFYEESDWATAYLVAESISRELSAQVVGITKQGDIVTADLPPKGASLAAWLKAMSSLLVTAGDRRRMQVEMTTPAVRDPAEESAVADLDEYRKRIAD